MTHLTNHLEIEVKFYLKDLDSMRKQILALGAESEKRVFETNIRFEDADKTLIKKKSLLRLRKDTKTTLTFKSVPDIKDSEFKILNEIEVEVNDFSLMSLILESLGFHNEQAYEKWRESFTIDGTILCLDTLPYGNFLEIEGKKENIKELASRLDLKWNKKIILNYLEIFSIIKRQLDLPFSDITFVNFNNIDIDLAGVLAQINIIPA